MNGNMELFTLEKLLYNASTWKAKWEMKWENVGFGPNNIFSVFYFSHWIREQYFLLLLGENLRASYMQEKIKYGFSSYGFTLYSLFMKTFLKHKQHIITKP